MEYCYRYWAWTQDIQHNEAEFMRNLALWNCTVEHRGSLVDIWVPERSNMIFQLVYPTILRHPVYDRY